MDDLVFFHRVIVDKTNRRIIPLRIVVKLSQDKFAAIACPVNQNLSSFRINRRRKHLAEKPKSHSAAGNCNKEQQTVGDKNRPRKMCKTVQKKDCQKTQNRAEHDTFQKSD